jgi:protein-disulfide isomerase
MGELPQMVQSFLRVIAVAGAAALAPLASAAAAEFSDAQKAEIETLVREYILANPEIVQEALVAIEEKRKQDEAAARTAQIQSIRDILYDSKHQVVLGNPDAKITLVEFFDYNCGYCKRALDDTLALLENDDVRIVLKEFPILGPGSVEAARVAIAVNTVAPDRYIDFHRELLTGNGQADERRALAVVEDIGLDVGAVKAAMSDKVVADTIDEVYTIANRLGLTGTPTYVIGDEVVFGAVGFEELGTRIAAMRECGKATC